MQKQTAIKRLKLAVILLAVAVVLSGHFQEQAGATQAQSQRLFELVGMSVPLEKRVGVDDGAVFAVHFGGGTRGNLDTCG